MSTHDQAKRTAEADAVVRFINQRMNAGGEVMGVLNLRDYFAAKAMQSMLLTIKRDQDVEIIHIASYRMADQMLKARQE